MSDNLYHKLLGLPENNESPNYYQMLELTEGQIDASKVEEAYKKQIQKVQRFTNNPKYKEGALFVKGELRKARSTLVDEGRRLAYQREMMTQRAQQIRGILRPLLIKGYLVEEEYKYLNQHAGRLGVPEAMVQQVLKQELQKKGIDPSTALVEGSGVQGKVSAKALPTGPQRKKKAVSMSLAARFHLFRDPLGTVGRLLAWPLRLLGIMKSPPKPQIQQAGFFDHHPYIATSLLWAGLLGLAVPFPLIHLTTAIGVKKGKIQAYEKQINQQKQKIIDLGSRRPVGRDEATRKELNGLYIERRELKEKLAAARSAMRKMEGSRNKAQAEVLVLKKQLASRGEGGSAALVEVLQGQIKDLKKDKERLREELREERAKKGGDDPAAMIQLNEKLKAAITERDAARAQHAEDSKKLQSLVDAARKTLSFLPLRTGSPLGKVSAMRSDKELLMQFARGPLIEPRQKFAIFRLEWIADVQVLSLAKYVKRGSTGTTAQAKILEKSRFFKPEVGQLVGVLTRK